MSDEDVLRAAIGGVARELAERPFGLANLRQDLAFAVPEEVTAGELVSAAREAAGPELREMRAFDVYRGEQTGPGRKSIAFSVSFQSPDRTLTDEEAAELRDRIVRALEARFDAELRS